MKKYIFRTILIAITIFSASTGIKANANLLTESSSFQVQSLHPVLATSTATEIIPVPLEASDFIFEMFNEFIEADMVYCGMPEDEEMRKAGFILMDNGKWMRSDAIVWKANLEDPEEDEAYGGNAGPIIIIFRSVYDAKNFMKTLDVFDWEDKGNLDSRYSCGAMDQCVAVTRNGKKIEILRY